MITTIIFDFDGTLADTFSTIVDIVNSHSEEFGYDKLTIESISSLRQLRAQEVLKIFKISIFKVPSLLMKVKADMSAQLPVVKLFPGIREALLALKEHKIQIGILSSNSLENVTEFLRQNDLEIFDFVYCEKDIFGKGRVLKRLLGKYQLDHTSVAYVGDETRDVEAAKSAAVLSCAVSWGYNTVSALTSVHPDVILDTPSELISITQ